MPIWPCSNISRENFTTKIIIIKYSTTNIYLQISYMYILLVVHSSGVHWTMLQLVLTYLDFKLHRFIGHRVDIKFCNK